jgi:hypothetical protein
VLIIIDNFGESFYSVCSVQGIVSVKSIGIWFNNNFFRFDCHSFRWLQINL